MARAQTISTSAATEARPARPRRRRRPSRLEVNLIRLLPMAFALLVVFKQYYIYIPGKLSWIYYHGYFFSVLFLLFTTIWVYRLRLRKRFVSSVFMSFAYNLIPPAMFFLLVFAQRQPIAAVFLFDFTVIVFALLRFSTVSESEDERKKNRQLNRAYRATACLFLCLMIIPTGLSVFKYRMLSSEEEFSIRITEISGEGLLEEIEAVNDKQRIYSKHSGLYQDLTNWNDLDTETRTHALAEVVEMECAIHGIRPDVTVKISETEQGTLGYFNHEDRTIVISASLMHDATPDRALNTTLHEFYHFFQRSVCELVEKSVGWDSPLAAIEILDEARQWKANFDLYLNLDNAGFEAYEAQPVEVSARAFAEQEQEKLQELMERAA